MSLEKIVAVDRIEIVNGMHIQVRTKTAVTEDGQELSASYDRHVISPGEDYSLQDEKVQAICQIFHTAEVIAAYQAEQEAAKDKLGAQT